MKKMKTTFMNYHPLRQELSKEDWTRIDKVLKNELDETNATTEEMVAAHDVFFDLIAGKTQTHLGVTTLQ